MVPTRPAIGTSRAEEFGPPTEETWVSMSPRMLWSVKLRRAIPIREDGIELPYPYFTWMPELNAYVESYDIFEEGLYEISMDDGDQQSSAVELKSEIPEWTSDLLDTDWNLDEAIFASQEFMPE
jgi:hypothetical protein